MKKRFVAISAFIVVLIAVGCGSGDSGSREEIDGIRAAYDGYKEAILRQDGVASSRFVDAGTITYYQRMRDLALEGDIQTVRAETTVDQLIIIMVRQMIPLTQLDSMDGRKLFSHAVNEGWIGVEGVINTRLGDVSVSGDRAVGKAIVDGESTSLSFEFRREGGEWKNDLVALLPASNLAFDQIIRESGQSDQAFLISILEAVSRKRVLGSIWDPMISDSGTTRSEANSTPTPILTTPTPTPTPTPVPTEARDAEGNIVPSVWSQLDFTVIDAEYSKPLDKIVMVSSSPDALHLYEPVTEEDYSIDLPLPPSSVSVHPNGLFAAVGHDGWISYVNLSTNEVEKTIPVSTDVFDVVLAANGYAYAFPNSGGWEKIRSVNIASEIETTHDGYRIYSGTVAKLHPDGEAMYGADNFGGSLDMEKYGIAEGTARVLYDSPYSGEYAMCGDLWISEDGLRIFTRCGEVFHSSPTEAQDMLYNGSLSEVKWAEFLTHSSTLGKVFVIPGNKPGNRREDDIPLVDTRIQMYNADILRFERSVQLPRFVVGSDSYSGHGRFVFVNRDASKIFIVVQANEDSGVLLDYGVVKFEPLDLIQPTHPITPTPSPTSVPTPTSSPTPSCTPGLISPPVGAVLDNGSVDGSDGIVWDFSWSECPGASLYHLYVIGETATKPTVNTVRDLANGLTSYRKELRTYIFEHSLNNWSWKVRGRFGDQWGEWSEPRLFDVELPQHKSSLTPLPSCTPALISPSGDAVLQDGTGSSVGTLWDFNWSDCPDATMYHFQVIGETAAYAFIDSVRTNTSIHIRTEGVIYYPNLGYWSWKVRARFGEQWGEWSEPQLFDVEPPEIPD